jgi:site-specific recombinase XerC
MPAFFGAIKASKHSVWMRSRDLALFRVAYHHGLRASELGMMQLSQYRVKSGRIQIIRLKGSNSGEYKTPRSCKLALDAWLQVRGYEDGPLFPSRRGAGISDQMIDVLMKEYAAAAEWPADLRHEHTMKHSCAVHLLEGGPGRPRMDIVAVQDWLGHVNIASTMVYAKITNRVRDEVGASIGSW